MKKQLTIVTILTGILLSSSTFIDSFPAYRVIKTYERLCDDSTGNSSRDIGVLTGSVMQVSDTNLSQFLPKTRFYFLVINQSPYVLNNTIRTIAAISETDSHDIRLLLQNGTRSTNFDSLFYGKPILNKDQVCIAITKILFQTYRRFGYHCHNELEMKQFVAKAQWSDEKLIVTVRAEERCKRDFQMSSSASDVRFEYEISDSVVIKRKVKEWNDYLVERRAVFSFKGDVITRIDYYR